MLHSSLRTRTSFSAAKSRMLTWSRLQERAAETIHTHILPCITENPWLSSSLPVYKQAEGVLRTVASDSGVRSVADGTSRGGSGGAPRESEHRLFSQWDVEKELRTTRSTSIYTFRIGYTRGMDGQRKSDREACPGSVPERRSFHNDLCSREHLACQSPVWTRRPRLGTARRHMQTYSAY